MAIEDHDALDAALEADVAEVHEVMSVVGLKAPGVDYGPEVSRINAAKAEIDSKLAELRGDVPAVEAEPEVDDSDGAAGAAAAGGAAGEAAPAVEGDGAGDAPAAPEGEPAPEAEGSSTV